MSNCFRYLLVAWGCFFAAAASAEPISWHLEPAMLALCVEEDTSSGPTVDCDRWLVADEFEYDEHQECIEAPVGFDKCGVYIARFDSLDTVYDIFGLATTVWDHPAFTVSRPRNYYYDIDSRPAGWKLCDIDAYLEDTMQCTEWKDPDNRTNGFCYDTDGNKPFPVYRAEFRYYGYYHVYAIEIWAKEG